jgi:hypothetical protein
MSEFEIAVDEYVSASGDEVVVVISERPTRPIQPERLASLLGPRRTRRMDRAQLEALREQCLFGGDEVR